MCWAGCALCGPCSTAARCRPYAVHSFTPSYRQIIDLSDFNRSVAILPGGQSGHPASRHYSDMIDAWRRLEYHPLLFDREEIERQAAGKLTLMLA